MLLATATANYVSTKHFTTHDGTHYTYDYVPPVGTNTTILLIHGFPSTRHSWQSQIPALTAAGYGIIAPDCLGYGDSDKPLDIEAYHLKRLGGHFMEILDREGAETVVGIGHDWGTNVLGRTAVWHRKRFEKLAFLSVGYSPPGLFFDVDSANALSLKLLGYMQFGYWYFFNSYNAAELAATNLESYFSLAFPVNNSAWAEDLAGLGTARAWLASNTTTPLPSYLTPDDKQVWISAYSQPGAVQASMNYYQTLMRGTQAADEVGLTDEDRTLRVPVLSIGGTQDMVTRADQLRSQIEPWAAAGYTEKTVDAGHWMTYEDSAGVSSILLEFLAS